MTHGKSAVMRKGSGHSCLPSSNIAAAIFDPVNGRDASRILTDRAFPYSLDRKGGQHDRNSQQRSTQASFVIGCRSAYGDAESAAVLGHARFRGCVARL